MGVVYFLFVSRCYFGYVMMWCILVVWFGLGWVVYFVVVGYCVVCELLVLRFVVWFCVLIVLTLVDSFIEVLSWLSIFLVWFGCCLCCLICFMWFCGLRVC